MHVLPSRCHVSVPSDPASPLGKERMVRTVRRDPGSSLAAITADFCNNIGTLLPRANPAACPQLAKADFASSSQHVRERQRIAALDAEVDVLRRQALALGAEPTADVPPCVFARSEDCRCNRPRF